MSRGASFASRSVLSKFSSFDAMKYRSSRTRSSFSGLTCPTPAAQGKDTVQTGPGEDFLNVGGWRNNGAAYRKSGSVFQDRGQPTKLYVALLGLERWAAPLTVLALVRARIAQSRLPHAAPSTSSPRPQATPSTATAPPPT